MRRAVVKRKRLPPNAGEYCPGTSAHSRQGHQRDELESKVVWHSTTIRVPMWSWLGVLTVAFADGPTRFCGKSENLYIWCRRLQAMQVRRNDASCPRACATSWSPPRVGLLVGREPLQPQLEGHEHVANLQGCRTVSWPWASHIWSRVLVRVRESTLTPETDGGAHRALMETASSSPRAVIQYPTKPSATRI